MSLYIVKRYTKCLMKMINLKNLNLKYKDNYNRDNQEKTSKINGLRV